MEEAQKNMCCHMRLDLAVLHMFSLEVAHPANLRDVSATATNSSLPEAQLLFASDLDLLLERSYSALCTIRLTVM